MKLRYKISIWAIALLTLSCAGIWLAGMVHFGGFDKIPQDISNDYKVQTETVTLKEEGDTTTFAIIGDMRWKSFVREGVIAQVQQTNPEFIVNLADVTEKARAHEWAQYYTELNNVWDKKTHLFHIPGGHSQNITFTGVKPEIYNAYFGRDYYTVEVPGWRLIFLNSRFGWIDNEQNEFFKQALADAKSKNEKILVFMHHPPYDEEQGITHAMFSGSSDMLYEDIKGYDVKGIFVAHIHRMKHYMWKGIPVYITALSSGTWLNDDTPAYYRKITLTTDGFTQEKVKLEKPKQ